MSEADDIVTELKSLKRKSMDRIQELCKQADGWLLLSKEATAHKMILGSLLGKADEPGASEPPAEKTASQDDKDLQDVMDGQ